MQRIRGNCSAVLLLCLLWGSSLQAGQLFVSAAASTTDALKEVVAEYKKVDPDTTVQLNFASSGALAKQIDQGAQADIFISANPKWMAFLVDQGKVDVDSRRVLATNSLVFVGMERAKPVSMESLTDLRNLAIGSPKSVPAGQYAEQAMTKAGVYGKLLDSGKLVMAKDVRQALIYADRGETEGAFVYLTDARLATKATVLFTVDQKLYDTVTYPMALTVAGAENQAARDFFAFLAGEEGGRVLARYGFSPGRP